MKDTSGIDVNTPVTNPALVEVMNKMREEVAIGQITGESFEAFAQEIASAHFLSPVVIEYPPDSTDAESDGKLTLKKGATISFDLLVAQDERAFSPRLRTGMSYENGAMYRISKR